MEPNVTQGPETSGQPEWRDSLPDELKSEKSLESIKDIPTLAKNYVEAQKYIGGSIRIPTDSSKPEEWNALYAKLGRPESPEKYELKHPEKSELPWSEELEKEARGLFHKIGLNSTQAQALIDFHQKNMEGMLGAAKASIEQGMAALQKEHGEKLPQVVEACQRFVAEFCTEEEIKQIEQTGRGNEPWFINMMARAWAERGEDSAPRGEHGASQEAKTEALQKIAQIRSDKNHPYHKGDSAALNEMDRLYRIAYSSQVVAETSIPEIN